MLITEWNAAARELLETVRPRLKGELADTCDELLECSRGPEPVEHTVEEIEEEE